MSAIPLLDWIGEPPPFPLPAGTPSEWDRLRRGLHDHLHHTDLGIIAHADWGQDVDRHLPALEALAAGRSLPEPFDWVPRDVLQYTVWDRDPPGPGATDWHLRRAFSAWALLKAIAEDPDDIAHFGFAGHVAALALSLPASGAGLNREAVGFLRWLAPRVRDVRQAPFVGVATLWFGLQDGDAFPGHAGVELVSWISAAEEYGSRVHQWSRGLGPGEHWLVSLTDDVREARSWQGLLRALADLPAARSRPLYAEWTGLWAGMAEA